MYTIHGIFGWEITKYTVPLLSSNTQTQILDNVHNVQRTKSTWSGLLSSALVIQLVFVVLLFYKFHVLMISSF